LMEKKVIVATSTRLTGTRASMARGGGLGCPQRDTTPHALQKPVTHRFHPWNRTLRSSSCGFRPPALRTSKLKEWTRPVNKMNIQGQTSRG
jgi:hypothetical protein